jgi:Rrf2 family protein
MKLVTTRRTDYGIRALIFLARAAEGHAKAGEIGAAMDIPTGFLQQVLQELQRARLVTSRSGPSGGYALARSSESITIRQIVEGLEGPIESQPCALRGGPCHWDEVCALHWVWSSAQAALGERLEEATLARIAADDEALAAGTAVVPLNAHRRPRAAHDR